MTSTYFRDKVFARVMKIMEIRVEQLMINLNFVHIRVFFINYFIYIYICKLILRTIIFSSKRFNIIKD